MHSPLDSQPDSKKWLRGALFLLVGALVVLALGVATAAAAESGEESEGGPPSGEPVIVPEVETPVTPPVSVPEVTPSAPSSAPVSKPTESAPSSSGTQTSHSTTRTTHSSGGGSQPSPTTVNHNSVRGPSSPSHTETRSSTGSGGGGSTQSTETSASSPAASTASPTKRLEQAVSALGANAGRAPAKGKKERQKALGNLGKAVGTALLGSQVKVSPPTHKSEGPIFVPSPAKNKMLYIVLILAVMAVAALVIASQFRGPRDSRRRKALMDHRTSQRLSPAERARARAHGRQWAAAAERAARRKAA